MEGVIVWGEGEGDILGGGFWLLIELVGDGEGEGERLGI